MPTEGSARLLSLRAAPGAAAARAGMGGGRSVLPRPCVLCVRHLRSSQQRTAALSFKTGSDFKSPGEGLCEEATPGRAIAAAAAFGLCGEGRAAGGRSVGASSPQAAKDRFPRDLQPPPASCGDHGGFHGIRCHPFLGTQHCCVQFVD